MKSKSKSAKKKRKPSAYALFVKKAYAGKVAGLSLRSLSGLTKEDRKKAFKHNAGAISKAYRAQ